jgi:hypothetical protein
VGAEVAGWSVGDGVAVAVLEVLLDVLLFELPLLDVAVDGVEVTAEVAVLSPAYVRAARTPKPPTAAMLASAVRIVSERSRSTARVRSEGEIGVVGFIVLTLPGCFFQIDDALRRQPIWTPISNVAA